MQAVGDTLDLGHLVNNVDMSDVVIVVKGKKIAAHKYGLTLSTINMNRVILGARSPVFHKMLFGKFEEGKT